jgi:hypothetical protein
MPSRPCIWNIYYSFGNEYSLQQSRRELDPKRLKKYN